MAKKDFLIFFSDQHSGQKCGYRHDKFAKTPNIDKLAQMGTTFDSAYTSCPLCVPARMSFLTSKYANKIDTLDLLATLSANFSTFAYSLGSIGYDTTLIGRMHFTGYDQRHGFLNRLTGDITPIIQGRPKEDSVMREERREYLTTLGAGYTDIVGGGGDTPVTEFDKQVVSDAIDFLQKDYDNPQLICVGPYAPHCTYVDPDEKRYRYYEEKFKDVTINPYDYEMPYFEGRRKYASLDMMRSVRSAYYGLIEFTDDNIGKVYNAFDAYLKRNNREGVFVYVSDHGDEVGEREMYGKMTLFEASANIPMIFVGAGVVKGRSVTAPTSIERLFGTRRNGRNCCPKCLNCLILPSPTISWLRTIL